MEKEREEWWVERQGMREERKGERKEGMVDGEARYEGGKKGKKK